MRACSRGLGAAAMALLAPGLVDLAFERIAQQGGSAGGAEMTPARLSQARSRSRGRAAAPRCGATQRPRAGAWARWSGAPPLQRARWVLRFALLRVFASRCDLLPCALKAQVALSMLLPPTRLRSSGMSGRKRAVKVQHHQVDCELLAPGALSARPGQSHVSQMKKKLKTGPVPTHAGPGGAARGS